jgi:predicted transcriptional regulator
MSTKSDAMRKAARADISRKATRDQSVNTWLPADRAEAGKIFDEEKAKADKRGGKSKIKFI